MANNFKTPTEDCTLKNVLNPLESGQLTDSELHGLLALKGFKRLTRREKDRKVSSGSEVDTSREFSSYKVE